MNRNLQYSYVRGISIFFTLILVGFLLKPTANAAKNEPANASTANKRHLAQAYAKLPLSFESNTGQTSDQVKFLSRGPGYTLFLTRDAEAVMVLGAEATEDIPEQKGQELAAAVKHQPKPAPRSVFRMKLVNAMVTPQADGLDELPGKANYFIGNDPKKWRSNVPTYAKVKYRDIYPGVDLVYYSNQRQLEYDFIVAPGADPHSVALSFTGLQRLSLDDQGALVLRENGRVVQFGKPGIYQKIDGERREIPGGYVLRNAHEVGFELAAYDATKPLIIDPTLSYSTYLGDGPISYGMAVDAAGNTYMTGDGCAADFPTTPGAFQAVSPGDGDAFVAKLNPTGSSLVYATCLGGSNIDAGFAIAIDGAGDAYVTGYSYSADFPTTPGAFQPINRAAGLGYNAFVTKLNPSGSALVYSTYLGGGNFGSSEDISVDAAGNAYVTGWTLAKDFPVTLNAFQLVNRGSENAFVTKLNADGTALLYSTYLGGSASSSNPPSGLPGDNGYGIAVDAQGNAYVTGSTCSSDFPVTPLAFQTVYEGNCTTAFMSKLNPAALLGPASLVYSTYLGGAVFDKGSGIAVDTQGNAYVAGTTCSPNFPITPLAFQIVNMGACDGFVSKLNPSVLGPSALVYSTFLGGTGGDGINRIAIDAAGNAYVTGITGSTDFPVTPDAFEATKASSVYSWDSFLTVLNPSGSAPLVFSTYFGASCSGAYYNTCNSSGESIAVDSSGNVYLTGWAAAPNFPTTPGAFQTSLRGGGSNAFVAKFSGLPTAP